MNMLGKIPVAAVAILGFMALLYPLVQLTAPHLLPVLWALYVVIGLVAGLGMLIASKKRAKKAEEFSEGINENAMEKPSTASADDLKKLDDMRQEFGRGLEIYQKYDKDLYDLPWYLVVGESGSGKTEAIRRSEIPFPPGLQDFMQGTGGTLSMHWWFTNEAVILDTAGRLMVREEGSAGTQDPQWTKFLGMLKQSRLECPINGLVLVIPADVLVPRNDPGEQATNQARIDNTARQIAEQMEHITHELGVRFPIYILITKCDQIIGFRDFFNYVDTAAERHQVLGWSNPNPLDTPLNYGDVEGCLAEIAERLRKRRMNRLLDRQRGQSEDERVSEMEALFAFPDNFEAIGPSLERYFRYIFSLGTEASTTWKSSIVPFLRGIYFTSALQEGFEVDEAVASALGLSLKDYLKRGKEEQEEDPNSRSYFIRDLVLNKVFQEKGLVCPVDRAVRSVGRWKIWVPVSLIIALLVVGGFGWWMAREDPPEVRGWLYFTAKGAGYSIKDGGFYPVVSAKRGGNYEFPAGVVDGHPGSETIVHNLKDLGTEHLSRTKPDLGAFYAPASWFDRGVAADRKAAYRSAVDQIIARPLVRAAINKLSVRASEDSSARSESWDETGVSRGDLDALSTLLRIAGEMPLVIDDKSAGAPDAQLTEHLERLVTAAGISATRNSDLISSMRVCLRVAHSDGKIPRELMGPQEVTAFRGIMDRLFEGSEATGLLGRLKAFEDADDSLKQLKPEDSHAMAEIAVGNLVKAAGVLRDKESRIKVAMQSLGSKADPAAPAADSGPVELLEAANILYRGEWEGKFLHDGGLRYLGQEDGKYDRWKARAQDPDSAGGTGDPDLKRLLETYCTREENGQARAFTVRSEHFKACLALGDEIVEAPDMQRVMKFLTAEKDPLVEVAVGLGKEVTDTLLDIKAQYLIAEKLPQWVGFPLVYDRQVGEEENVVLSAEKCAGVALMTHHLGELSDAGHARVRGLTAVAKELFDFEKLQTGKIVVKDWSLRMKDESSPLAVTKVTLTPLTPAKGTSMVWEVPKDGNAERQLRADLGGELRWESNREPPEVGSVGLKRDNWAPVHWFLRKGATHEDPNRKILVYVDGIDLDPNSWPKTSDLTNP
jgi:hypothetical protein